MWSAEEGFTVVNVAHDGHNRCARGSATGAGILIAHYRFFQFVSRRRDNFGWPISSATSCAVSITDTVDEVAHGAQLHHRFD